MKKSLIKVLLIVILIGVGYGVGFLHGHRNLVFEANLKPRLVSTELRKPKEVDFSLFWDAYNLVETKHTSQLDPVKATYGAIEGLLKSLKDPFTAFLEPSEAKLFTQDLKGEFGGIGAELASKDSRLVVVSPIEGTPADKAGLKPKDEIIKIDGEDVSLLSFSQAIEKIRGDKGKPVTLQVARAGVDKPFDLTIVRETIRVKSATFRESDGVGILRISQFNEDTLGLVRGFADQIGRAPGLVVDLRNNPGGLLQTAIDVASLFTDQGPILQEQGKDGKTKRYEPSQKPIFNELKLVVLINEGSASASEIFAGALQDHGRAKLVGTKSFGKGSVQNLERLRDGSMVRLTVAAWMTPKGRQINSSGIAPDIEIVQPQDGADDVQLKKAIELLTK